MDRRLFLAFAGSAAVFGANAKAQVTGAVLDPAENSLIDTDGMEAFDPWPQGFSAPRYSTDFGNAEPPEFYTKIARILLRGAPIDCRPVDVAKYLYDIRVGKLTDAVLERLENLFAEQNPVVPMNLEFVSLFAYDWEKSYYFNPVVVQIINGTKTDPYDGDATPWCASFANWCIARSKASYSRSISFDSLLSLGTRSAASGSFRCWGEQTEEPKEGDLVVFAKKGTETQGCPINLSRAQGHVGFYVGETIRPNGSVRYKVLGGNQGFIASSAPNETQGSLVSPSEIRNAVSIREYGKAWSDRVFHSFRTSSILQG